MTNKNNLSFNFLNTNGGTSRKATTGQINYYNNLCAQRGIVPDDVSEMSFDDLRVKIDELKSHRPLSPAQKEIITRLVGELSLIGINITVPDNLQGGFGGSGSKFIEKLIKLQKKNTVSPPSDRQVEVLVGWFLCPDVPFEDYGIVRTITLDDNNWRKLTPQEFAEEIINNLTTKTASEIIEKYSPAFREWRGTRIRPGQFNYLKQLFERVEQDIEDIDLLQLSQEEAEEWIKQLKYESSLKFPTTLEGPAPDYMATPQTIEEAVEHEETMIKNIIYKIIAESNIEPLHDVENMLGNNSLIREYVLHCVSIGAIEFENIARYCEDSEGFKEILASA